MSQTPYGVRAVLMALQRSWCRYGTDGGDEMNHTHDLPQIFELNRAGRQGNRTDDLYFERERAEADALYNLAERLSRATPDQLEQLRIDAQTLMGAIAEPSE